MSTSKVLAEVREAMNESEKSEHIYSVLKSISLRLDNIESNQIAIMKLTSRVTSIETEVTNIKTQNTDLESKLTTNTADIKVIQKQLNANNNMAQDLGSIRQANVKLQDTVTDLQCRSMKNNLVFRGLQEQPDENISVKVRNFIKQELGVERDLEFGNIHRFGKPNNGRPRPIVVRFLYYDQLSMVRDNAYRLKNKNFSINEQFPPHIEEVRRTLYPVAKHYKSQGHRTKMVRDKLFINGEEYRPVSFVPTTSGNPTSATQGPMTNTNYVHHDTPNGTTKPNNKRSRVGSSPAPGVQDNPFNVLMDDATSDDGAGSQHSSSPTAH